MRVTSGDIICYRSNRAKAEEAGLRVDCPRVVDSSSIRAISEATSRDEYITLTPLLDVHHCHLPLALSSSTQQTLIAPLNTLPQTKPPTQTLYHNV